MSDYKMDAEQYAELLQEFDLQDVRVTDIRFHAKPELEPDDFRESRLKLQEKKHRWTFPDSKTAVATSSGKFEASTVAEGGQAENSTIDFVTLGYTIEFIFSQDAIRPDEFYKIFAEQSLWRIAYPFIRELVTNIPHRAGFIFPPPPLAIGKFTK